MSRGWLSKDRDVASVKRSVYLVGLPIGALLALLPAYLEALQGNLHIVDRVGLPLLAGLMLFLIVPFRRQRRPLFVLEFALFGGFSLMLLASLSYSVFQLPAGGDSLNLTGLGYWTPLFYTLAFLIFGVRTGLKISSLVYLLMLSVWGAKVLLGGSSADPMLLFQLFASNGLLLLLLYGFGVLVQVQSQHAAQYEKDANTDALTQLPNRHFLSSQLTQELERARRYSRTFSVALIDLDHFKHINDTFGQQLGDKVLQEVAELLRSHARALDSSGRWGGEEFLLLLPELPLQAAYEVTERFRLRLETHDFRHGERLTLSSGVAEYDAGDTLELLLGRADEALYEAKLQGRNCVMPGGLIILPASELSSEPPTDAPTTIAVQAV